MSHELRTPLNAIIGFAGTLMMKLAGPLNEEQERQLRTIQVSSKHLLSLINDLLDLAKIESGKVELSCEPVDCRKLLEEVASTLRPMAEEKGLGFEVSAPLKELVIDTDWRALRQILLNLVNNAIKFTAEGSVRVEVQQRPVNGLQATEFAVIDTGVGIRPEDQERLFQAFSQVDAHTRRREGTGLGLHLSQRLAQLLGGQISVESEYGKGSTFRLVVGVPEKTATAYASAHSCN
ncbi:MAG TPA: ATP-binding protein [Terriglobales bacterium]|jgi:protein-histidine pros-kinase|nr:ATP-binding protein [Terriglobales bacterium]